MDPRMDSDPTSTHTFCTPCLDRVPANNILLRQAVLNFGFLCMSESQRREKWSWKLVDLSQTGWRNSRRNAVSWWSAVRFGAVAPSMCFLCFLSNLPMKRLLAYRLDRTAVGGSWCTFEYFDSPETWTFFFSFSVWGFLMCRNVWFPLSRWGSDPGPWSWTSWRISGWPAPLTLCLNGRWRKMEKDGDTEIPEISRS